MTPVAMVIQVLYVPWITDIHAHLVRVRDIHSYNGNLGIYQPSSRDPLVRVSMGDVVTMVVQVYTMDYHHPGTPFVRASVDDIVTMVVQVYCLPL